jgi:hypothetical protein
MNTDHRPRFSDARSPEHLLQFDLAAAYYPGPNKSAQEIRETVWHLQRESKLQWRVRTFETAMHYSHVSSGWTPDVAITHWHGEARTGPLFDLPTQIAQRFGRQRENTGAGPFLAGQFSPLDIRFDPHDPRSLITNLLTSYDMLFCQADLWRVFRNVAIGLWNSHRVTEYLPRHVFDADFEAYTRDAASAKADPPEQ